MNNEYKGWTIVHEPNAPVTGRYKAWRHGVRIGAGTKEDLKSMIDTRNALEREKKS